MHLVSKFKSLLEKVSRNYWAMEYDCLATLGATPFLFPAFYTGLVRIRVPASVLDLPDDKETILTAST